MKSLPSIEDDLRPRRPDLKSLRGSLASDAEIEQNSRTLGNEWGASTSLKPPSERIPLASLRIEIPEYLDLELAKTAVEQRVTKQYLVLKALQQAGFHVDPEHIVEDKRKVRTRRK
jgi:hypothetical protein